MDEVYVDKISSSIFNVFYEIKGDFDLFRASFFDMKGIHLINYKFCVVK